MMAIMQNNEPLIIFPTTSSISTKIILITYIVYYCEITIINDHSQQGPFSILTLISSSMCYTNVLDKHTHY